MISAASFAAVSARWPRIRTPRCQRPREEPNPPSVNRRRGRGKRLGGFHHRVNSGRNRNVLCRRRPAEVTAQAQQQGERDQEFEGSAEPQPIAHLGAVAAKHQGQKSGQDRENHRLPEMVHQFAHHGIHRFPSRRLCASSLCTVFCNSRTSSMESFPASASCAIMGRARPPKKLRISSKKLRRRKSRGPPVVAQTAGLAVADTDPRRRPIVEVPGVPMNHVPSLPRPLSGFGWC